MTDQTRDEALAALRAEPNRVAWMLVTHTMSQGLIPSVWADDDRPVLYETEAEAVADADDFHTAHNDRLRADRESEVAGLDEALVGVERFGAIRSICCDYQPDDEPMDWPIEVSIAPDGTITDLGTFRRWTADDIHQLRS